MTGKKPMSGLKPIAVEAKPKAPADDIRGRGSVQTVRMDRDTLKALKYASIERGISQQDIMLAAIRRDLAL